MSVKQKLLAVYRRHESYAPAIFFVVGFLFDIVTLGRIDDVTTIAQQGAYLAILSLLVILELKNEARPYAFTGRSLKAWEQRELVIHFLFGSLLSAYTLFFFKSASFESSFVFLIVMSFVMVANEIERFQRLGPLVRFILLSLCITCYLSYLTPMLLGFIGLGPFLIALVFSSALVFVLTRLASPGSSRRLIVSGLAVQTVFLGLYLLQLIPPVPLSAQAMGIYHNVEKAEGHYALSYARPWWRFWESGAQTFLARPGDRVYVYARVFAPARFKDELKVRWLYRDPRTGWSTSDAIPFPISGGRKEGYRGFTFKQNYVPGKWMVRLETSDAREIARIRFEIVPISSEGELHYLTEID